MASRQLLEDQIIDRKIALISIIRKTRNRKHSDSSEVHLLEKQKPEITISRNKIARDYKY